MAATVTHSTGYTIDLGRYFKVAFALLGVTYSCPPHSFGMYSGLWRAAEITYFIISIASVMSLVQLWLKTYIVLVVLAIGILLTELILLVVLSASMFPWSRGMVYTAYSSTV